MRSINLASFMLAVFIAIGGVVVAGPSYAVSLVGTTTDAQGIDGLLIGSTTYDVTFVNNSYNSVYPPGPTFLGDTSGANAAAAALTSALNDLSVTNLVGLPASQPGGFGTPNLTLVVPYSSAVGDYAVGCATYPSGLCTAGTWGATSDFPDPGATYTYLDYTVFTVAETPLPATLPLLASGIGALGLLGWRGRRKNAAALAA